MDRQGNKDGSNFFSRIKNIDVLKSPYPRHLMQGGRGSTAATSTRPVVASTSPQYNTARPAPVHGAPVWQTPVLRHGDIAISPTGSGSRVTGSGPTVPQISPYRLQTEYPNSVQPIRSRPRSFPEQRFVVPGSTLPTHIRPGGAVRSPASSMQVCLLQAWFACLDPEKRTITVSGSFIKPNGKTVLRHSTPIEHIHDSRILLATTGTIYQLASSVDVEMMRVNGFPEHLVPYFVDGFPRNWRDLIDGYFNSAIGNSHSTGGISSRNESNSRPSLSLLRRKDSFEEIHKFHGIDRISTIAENDEDALDSVLHTSSSGPSSAASTYAHAHQARVPDTSAYTAHTSSRSSVYRSGADIFNRNRFIQANHRHSSESVDVASSSTVGGSAYLAANEDIDDSFNAIDGYESNEELEHGVSTYLEKSENTDNTSSQSMGENAIHRLEGALDDMRVEQESPVPQSPPESHISATPELTISDENQQQQDNAADEEGNEEEVEGDEDDAVQSSLIAKSKARSARQAQISKHQNTVSSSHRRSSRRIIETSDDSGQHSTDGLTKKSSEEASPPPPLATPSAKRSLSKATRAHSDNNNKGRTQKSTFSVRTARRTTLLETPTKPASKTKSPHSAPSGRAKGKRSLGLRTPSKRQSHSDKASTDPAAASKAEKRPSSPKPKSASEQQPHSISTGWLVDDNTGSQAVVEKDDNAGDTFKAVSTESPTEDGDGEFLKSESSPSKHSITTPKRKVGRRYFRYHGPPEPSVSVTRSGRKVNRPKEWWANAQEHLSGGHKESDLKYKWGTGDPVLVKGSKRIRLSDYYLENDGDDSFLKSDSADADADIDADADADPKQSYSDESDS
ncbi:hypothetical protein GGI26_004751 [Coemansia sp. RSA 1358]|uniref:SANTA domain-containing protein n=1 Tax=Coemansia umbellata TaxID=1424467 RepID=A0ABQ8PIW1_9FUNG|nr:hypothetical protein EDC05_004203 [Coemansia umbellata]KAJ2620673.1 hypothetical protein GGI26_004751 [Coemansia sp. RSA 1358]